MIAIVSLLAFASTTLAVQVSSPAQPRTVTHGQNKSCPDGSVIRETQTCAEFPDHRKLYSLSPDVTIHSIEWTCGKRMALVRVRVTEVPATIDGRTVGKAKFKIELLKAGIGGSPLSAQSLTKLRLTLSELNELGVFDGRCFYGDIPSLKISGFRLGNPKETPVSEIELR
ncbi:hypothetical protein [Sphingomonas flavescens]|uniref:hypothetical protein n=1 Tax=Sphingomonas flavescens TaxID=3132797 RepID=UPI002804C91E|nr:hypothetical protein [Sphingomonas limnosediminicola]